MSEATGFEARTIHRLLKVDPFAPKGTPRIIIDRLNAAAVVGGQIFRRTLARRARSGSGLRG
jgi:hypothetical protein